MDTAAAFHESGHAVVAHYVGARVRINGAWPSCECSPDLADPWARVLIGLAGPLAELRYSRDRRTATRHGWRDRTKVQQIARDLHRDHRQADQFIQHAAERTTAILDRHWSAVEALAEELRNRWSMSGPEVSAIIERTPRRPATVGGLRWRAGR